MPKPAIAGAMKNWRSINTAPRDGTFLDVWCNDKRIINVHWVTTVGGNSGWYELGVARKQLKPTHWMPRPDDPIIPEEVTTREALGRLMQAARILLGFNQKEMGDAADFSHSTVSRIEAGDGTVKSSSIDQLEETMIKHGIGIGLDDETGEACLTFEFLLNDPPQQAAAKENDDDDLDLDGADNPAGT